MSGLERDPDRGGAGDQLGFEARGAGVRAGLKGGWRTGETA